MFAAIVSACAFTAVLSSANARDASQAAVAMVHAHLPYAVRPWVLYQSADPLRATHGAAGIDAVIVETPYERVRYETYLHALQGDRITPEFLTAQRQEAQDHVGFVVFAHSANETDRGFFGRLGKARIALPLGGFVEEDERELFGPSLDFYDVAAFREERWTGSVTFRFPAICGGRGTLNLRDGYGRRYSFPFDLRKYR